MNQPYFGGRTEYFKPESATVVVAKQFLNTLYGRTGVKSRYPKAKPLPLKKQVEVLQNQIGRITEENRTLREMLAQGQHRESLHNGYLKVLKRLSRGK